MRTTPLVDNCTGCGRFRSVDIIGYGKAEFPLCRPCKEIYGEVDDLIELWARTGLEGRRHQVYEARLVEAFEAAGLEIRYAEEASDTRYLPEYRAAKEAVEAIRAQDAAFAALDARDAAGEAALDWVDPEGRGA